MPDPLTLSVADAFPEIARALGENGMREAFQLELGDDPEALVDANREWLCQRVAEQTLQLASPTAALSDLFPRLNACGDDPIPNKRLNRRSRNVIGRGGVRTWRDLGKTTIATLRAIPGAGRTTVLNVLEVCADESLLRNGGIRPNATTPPNSAEPVAAPETAGELTLIADVVRQLATWAVLEGVADKLGDVIKVDGDHPLPDDVRHAWTCLADVDPRRVADPSLLGFTLPTFIERLLEGLTGNLRRVYEARVLSDAPLTLEAVGQELGVTRERVRQLQSQAEGRVTDLLNMRESAPFRWRAAALASVLGPYAPSDDDMVRTGVDSSLRGCDHVDYLLARRLMLRVAGPYVERHGWLVRHGASLPDPAELTASADSDGLIPVSHVYAWLAEKGMRAAYHDRWIDDQKRLRLLGEYVAVWAGSVVEKAAALLAVSGEPSTVEALVAAIGEGHNVRGVRQRLFDDERFVRVSRSQWALRAWGLEEYTGIAEEIVQRIEEWGGRARLSDLVRELVPLFGVKEASVRVYAEAPMFVLEDGWVRLRGADEPFTVDEDITQCRGVYRPAANVVSYLLAVDRDVLRGSGRPLPASVACVLGVLPGGRRAFSTSDEVVVVTWPENEWNVGHFVALQFLVVHHERTLVGVLDTYPDLGWRGHHLQPGAAAVAALLRPGDQSEGGLLCVCPADQHTALAEALEQQGLALGDWDNGSAPLAAGRLALDRSPGC